MLQEVWIPKLWGGGGGGGGFKIEGRHVLIIALSEHRVDYMNRKGWSLRYYAGGGTFSPMCTSDSRLGRDIIRK